MQLQAPWTWRASLGLFVLAEIDCYLEQPLPRPG
jgi:hypothetical protein